MAIFSELKIATFSGLCVASLSLAKQGDNAIGTLHFNVY